MEFQVKDVSPEEDRSKECYQIIMQALAHFGCRFHVEALLRENGTNFMIAVVPKEKKDENIESAG